MSDIPLESILGMLKLVDTSAGPEACWPWKGSVSRVHRNKPVYGLSKKKKVWVQRFIFELSAGKKLQRHLNIHIVCGNRRCCNPSHLEAHKSGWGQKTFYPRQFVMTEEQVKYAQRLWYSGTMTMKAISEHLGMKYCTVQKSIANQHKTRKVNTKLRRKKPPRFKKLNTQRVQEIKKLRAEGRKLKELSEMFGVTESHISRLVRGLVVRGA